MGLIYLDGNLLIDAVEAVPVFATHVMRSMEKVAHSREDLFAISPLVKMECSR
ncbi:MAG TPA: hypothetical protein VN324_05255 [Quisquiliibacterium sp.]|nr:hypothetical protein [Quisquiliibacterium sp.]